MMTLSDIQKNIIFMSSCDKYRIKQESSRNIYGGQDLIFIVLTHGNQESSIDSPGALKEFTIMPVSLPEETSDVSVSS